MTNFSKEKALFKRNLYSQLCTLVLFDEVPQECLLAAPQHVAAPVDLHHGLHLLAEVVHAPLLEDHAVADRALVWTEQVRQTLSLVRSSN